MGCEIAVEKKTRVDGLRWGGFCMLRVDVGGSWLACVIFANKLLS
jgi:hypothetical protein